jgi:hypothetical protein
MKNGKLGIIVAFIAIITFLGFSLSTCEGVIPGGGGSGSRPTKYCQTDKKRCRNVDLCVDDLCRCHWYGISECRCYW